MIKKFHIILGHSVFYVVLFTMLNACGGDSSSDPAASFTIGGTISGMTGTGLILQNNGGDDFSITANGSFQFGNGISDRSSYTVSVLIQPANPSQTCILSNNTGTVNGADINNIMINCITDIFTVGGAVSGLAASGLVIQNNGVDDLPFDTDATFTFGIALVDGTSYAVTVSSQPGVPNLGCDVRNGTGTLNGANISNVSVSCAQFGSASKIESEDLGAARGAAMVVDDAGNVTAVWEQMDATINNLWSNRYTVSTGWGTAEKIENEDLGVSLFNLSLIIDSSGNVTAAWDQNDSGLSNLWSNRYTVGSGWGTAIKIESEDLSGASAPNLVIDSDDNITVVWTQHDGARNNQWSNRMDAQ